MSIGQALAEARRQAGLTVADVSQRTRIREGVIRGIEADDFSICGGDFYARGHIRSIAKVIGADPVPLVAEYDQVWRDQGGTTDVRHVMDLITESRTAPPADAGAVPPDGPAAAPPDGRGAGPGDESGTWPVGVPGASQQGDPGTGPLGEDDTGPLGPLDAGPPDAGPAGEPGAWPGSAPGTGHPGEPGAWPGSAPGTGHPGEPGTWPGSAPGTRLPSELVAASRGTPGPAPWRTRAPGRRPPGSPPPRRRLNWTAVLAVGIVLALGLIGYQLMSGSGGPPPAAAPGTSSGAATRHPAEHGSGTPVPPRSAAPSPTPSSPGAAAPPAVASRSLTPASAVAFGAGGAGAGDNSDLAHLAVDGSQDSAWHTDWYTSASFGNLYDGTGLLLDLGRPAAITGARITLGSAPGADFELRAGSSPGALRTVARARGASGQVNLRLASPVHGRYLLIWFTRLPDDAGSFEAAVHDVKVTVQA